jgi:hypothetical protein
METGGLNGSGKKAVGDMRVACHNCSGNGACATAFVGYSHTHHQTLEIENRSYSKNGSQYNMQLEFVKWIWHRPMFERQYLFETGIVSCAPVLLLNLRAPIHIQC